MEKLIAAPTKRGLNRRESAAYVGVSPATFDRMVVDGLMPGPQRVYARTIWDVRKIDAAIDLLPGDADSSDDDGSVNEWD